MSNILKYSDFVFEYLSPGYRGRYKNYTDYYRGYSSDFGDYSNRVRDYGLSSDASILKKTENFFQKMEDRINAMADSLTNMQQSQRINRGGGPNTGVELLFGLPSVVPSVLKRIFAPTKTGYTNKWEGIKFDKVGKGDKEEDINFMRHTNNDFIKNDLPNIKNETDLQNNIMALYKSGGVKTGENPMVDEIAKNRANIFYNTNR